MAEINIAGVDTRIGLSLYGGDIDTYITVLRSYASNVLSTMDKMRDVSAENLKNYSIYVHSLKGVNALIGAEEVRYAAARLEAAAKDGNIGEILAGNEPLLKSASAVVYAVKDWLAQHDSNISKPQLPHPDKKLLARLRKCCETYDIDSIDSIMDELEKANYDKDADLVTWLRKKVNESDFSQIVSRLK